MKKFAIVLLSVLFVFSCAFVAFADPASSGYEITVQNPIKNEVYTAYKIFDVSHSEGSQAYSYSISAGSPWWSIVTTPAVANPSLDTTADHFVVDGYVFDKTANTDGSGNNIYLVTLDSSISTETAREQAAKTLADKINATNLTGKPVAGTATASDSDTPVAVIDVGGPGYYFVDTSAGSLCAIDTAAKTASIREKNSVPGVNKQIKSGSSYIEATAENPASASIGDTIEFKITVTNGVGCDQNIIVRDTMSDGVELTDVENNDITVKVGDSDTPVLPGEHTYELLVNDAQHFTITLLAEYVSTLADNTVITITYSGRLNDDAAISGNTDGDNDTEERNTNTVRLEYAHQITTDVVYIDTYKVDIVKTDSENNVIDGAKFTLAKTNQDSTSTAVGLVVDSVEYVVDPDTGDDTDEVKSTTYRPALPGETPVAAIDAGIAHIVGLGSGSYTLTETQAPEGYNPLDEPYPFTVTGNNVATLTADDTVWSQNGVPVVNYTGSQLPFTGGIGTYLFTGIGALLVVGAVVVLVSKKRMRAYSE